MDNVKFSQKDICERTLNFDVRVINLVNFIPKTSAGIAIGNQIVRSGTSIGANIEEAQDALSKKDFIHSMTIALKEARETNYWLKIILKSGLISESRLKNINDENIELIKIITTIVKKSKIR